MEETRKEVTQLCKCPLEMRDDRGPVCIDVQPNHGSCLPDKIRYAADKEDTKLSLHRR